MTIPFKQEALEQKKFKESTVTAGQVGVVVVNSDGSAVGGGAISAIVPGTGATNLGKAEDAAHASGDVGIFGLSVRQDTLASSTTTDGDYQAIKSDSLGAGYVHETQAPNYEEQTVGVALTLERPTASQSYVVSLDNSAAAEASSVTKASAGRLYGFVFSNANGATRYLQFFNSTTVPADTAVPFLVFTVATATTLKIEFQKGIPFSTGIAWCNSSTQHTKTVGSTDSLANVFYA